jgi:hypothetical protein
MGPASRLIGEIGIEPTHLVRRSADRALEQVANLIRPLTHPGGRMERKQSGGDKAGVIEKVVRRGDASRKAPRQRRVAEVVP